MKVGCNMNYEQTLIVALTILGVMLMSNKA